MVQCRRKDGEAWTEGGDDVQVFIYYFVVYVLFFDPLFAQFVFNVLIAMQVRVLGPLPEDVRRALEEERMLIADEDDGKPLPCC